MKSVRINLDALGMCASSLCMIHCLVFPTLLAVLPMWKLATNEAQWNAEGRICRDCSRSNQRRSNPNPFLPLVELLHE